MTVGFDPYVAARFIRAKLIQQSTLASLISTRVFRDVAPPDAAYPYVLMTLAAAEDLRALEAVKVWTNTLWQVEYWSRTNDDGVIAQGAALIDTALHKASGAMTGATYGNGNVYTTYRERALSLPAEVDGDVIWRRGGGEYRCLVAAT